MVGGWKREGRKRAMAMEMEMAKGFLIDKEYEENDRRVRG